MARWIILADRYDTAAGEALFRAADSALYAAKNRGRNRVSAPAQ